MLAPDFAISQYQVVVARGQEINTENVPKNISLENTVVGWSVPL